MKSLPFPLVLLWRFFAFALFVTALVGIQDVLFRAEAPPVNPYYQDVLLNAGIAIILAVSLNLINGITGQFSLGHAGFMAVGAYVSAYFTKEIGGPLLNPISFAIGISLGALAAGLAGFVVGLPSLRLRGDYLAIVTLGFNQIIVSLIQNISVVGGASGYSDIPAFTSFAWVFALVVVCIWSIRNLAVSNLGRSMRAVRDDEIAAEASGINTTRVKVIAFVYSAMWAGVAGALQAHYIQTATPKDFTFLRSIEVVVSVVLGGLGSITGAALSATGLTVLQVILRGVPGAFYTSIALVGIAAYWNTIRLRNERSPRSAHVRGFVVSIFALIVLCTFYYSPILKPALERIFPRLDFPDLRGFLESSKGALRYVIYSVILIVVMLLRPQGLLGRREWSFAALRRTRGNTENVEGKLV